MDTKEQNDKRKLKEITQGPGFTLVMLTLAGRLTRERLTEVLEPTGLHPRHFGILLCLQYLGPLPQGIAAQRMAIDKSTAVAVIDDLEAWGYVERRRNPQDRRRYALMVTEAGVEKTFEGLSISDESVEEILGPLDKDELNGLRNSLSQVLKHHGAF